VNRQKNHTELGIQRESKQPANRDTLQGKIPQHIKPKAWDHELLTPKATAEMD